nr:hypothetical protein [Tanacetum cinerariifolium]
MSRLHEFLTGLKISGGSRNSVLRTNGLGSFFSVEVVPSEILSCSDSFRNVVEKWGDGNIYYWHYNIKPLPQRQFSAFPGDLSLGIGFPDDLSPGNVRWGTLVKDSFPSDNLQRNGGSHIFSSKEISATVAHIPQRHVAEENPNLN